MKDIDSERVAPSCYLSKERVRSDLRRIIRTDFRIVPIVVPFRT